MWTPFKLTISQEASPPRQPRNRLLMESFVALLEAPSSLDRKSRRPPRHLS